MSIKVGMGAAALVSGRPLGSEELLAEALALLDAGVPAQRVVADVISRLQGETPLVAETELLTQRELEVLALLADGIAARSIALRLQVSTSTVHKHLGRIYGKLDVHDRLVAVHEARRRGLLRSR